MYITYHKRERKDKKSNFHRWQSGNRELSHTTPDGRWHDSTSKETTQGHFWSPGGITHAV